MGNADGDPGNDLATRDEIVIALSGSSETDRYQQLYGQFGRSWRIDQAASLFDGRGTGGPALGLPREEALAYAQPGFPSALMPSALVDAGDLPPEVRQAAEAICRQAGVRTEDFLADCVLDVGVTGEVQIAASAAVEALFAPPVADPYLYFQFDGPISAAGGESWQGDYVLNVMGFGEYSGTMQILIGVDPTQPGDPVPRMEAMIELQLTTFTEEFVECACTWKWSSVEPYLSRLTKTEPRTNAWQIRWRGSSRSQPPPDKIAVGGISV